jgi:hypothetical protein
LEENLSGIYGAGAWLGGSSRATIGNSTFVANDGDGLACENGSQARVVSSILWANSPVQIRQLSASIVDVQYSNIQGGWAGPGRVVIDTPPQFVDAASGDYRLAPESACIDAGHNWGVPQDTADLDEDDNTRELTPFDLGGNPRFSADEVDFDTGCGVPVVVDMGAYEYQFDPVDELLFADTDANLAVDVDDLVSLLLDWGSCGDACCLSDFDLNGQVDVDDLLALLLSWG